MNGQALWHLLEVAILPALGVAMIAITVCIIRHRQHTAAIRRRMAEFNASRPELAALDGGEARRQGVWRRHKPGSDLGAQSRAA